MMKVSQYCFPVPPGGANDVRAPFANVRANVNGSRHVWQRQGYVFLDHPKGKGGNKGKACVWNASTNTTGFPLMLELPTWVAP